MLTFIEWLQTVPKECLQVKRETLMYYYESYQAHQERPLKVSA